MAPTNYDLLARIFAVETIRTQPDTEPPPRFRHPQPTTHATRDIRDRQPPRVSPGRTIGLNPHSIGAGLVRPPTHSPSISGYWH